MKVNISKSYKVTQKANSNHWKKVALCKPGEIVNLDQLCNLLWDMIEKNKTKITHERIGELIKKTRQGHLIKKFKLKSPNDDITVQLIEYIYDDNTGELIGKLFNKHK